MAPEELFDDPNAGSAVDALNVELDARNAGFPCSRRFDELQPLVIDAAGFDVCGWKPGTPAQLVVPRQPRLGENGVNGAAASAAVRCEGVAHQRLRTMQAARGGPQRSRGRWLADGWLSLGHG